MNYVEQFRKESLLHIFSTPTFENSFNVWKKIINKKIGAVPTADKFIGLGDHLSDIFKLTGKAGRAQETLSARGLAWES